MHRGRLETALGFTVILLLIGAIAGLQWLRERRFTPLVEPAAQVLYLSSPAVVTRAALSFDAIVADLYWIRAIQYIGQARLRGNNPRYDLLYPLLDLTTALDPQFSVAYRFGAFFLSEERPGGAGRPDLAIRLLEKAMAQHPRRWEYAHDIGFIYYRDGDFNTAAEWFRRASELPGAAEWLGPLAAVTLTAGGDARSARLLWRQLRESEAEWLRQIAVFRLRQLDAVDEAARLEQAVNAYARRFGSAPSSWQQMMRAGMLRGVPLDPAGHPYRLDPQGDVTVDRQSPLWPLPTERPS